jgi:putative membrane protein
MDPTPQTHLKASLADFFAEERTFLAWIRTGLALMGFGFVVARFGLFLQELQTMQRIFIPESQHQLSVSFGITLIVIGAGVNLYAAWRHVQFIGQLNSGEVTYPRPSKRAALLALLLALIGLAMAFYLTFLRTSAPPSVDKASAGQARSVEFFASSNNGVIHVIASDSTVHTRNC